MSTGKPLTLSEAAAESWIGVVMDGKSRSEVFENSKIIESVLDQVEEMAFAFTPDTSTDKGRREIASQAYKVARTKTGLDEAGKSITAEWKARIVVIDANRKRVRERLDKLRDDVRKPLTEWEEADAARIAKIKAKLDEIRQFGTRDYVRQAARLNLRHLANMREELDATADFDFDEFTEEAEREIDKAYAEIDLAVDIVKERDRKAEADRIAAEERKRLDDERKALMAEREAIAAERRKLDLERAEMERAKAVPEPKLNGFTPGQRIASTEPDLTPSKSGKFNITSRDMVVISETVGPEITVPMGETAEVVTADENAPKPGGRFVIDLSEVCDPKTETIAEKFQRVIQTPDPDPFFVHVFELEKLTRAAESVSRTVAAYHTNIVEIQDFQDAVSKAREIVDRCNRLSS